MFRSYEQRFTLLCMPTKSQPSSPTHGEPNNGGIRKKIKMRTKKDKCLICKVNDATNEGSHLMPAGLSAPCDNGRSKEELYFIGETINVYYGSNNSKNNNIIHDTTRHTNYNVLDYIFCPICEKKLSVIESAVIPFLIKTVPSNKGFGKENKTIKGLTYKEYSNVDLAEFKLFFYTVIWRLGLEQELNFGTNIFSDEEYEKLRSVIDKYISLNLTDITKNQGVLDELPLTIITSNYQETSANIYAPHRVKNNPPLFLACQYLAFIHFNEYVILNPNFGLPLEVFNKSLINKDSPSLKIAFLADDEWYSFIEKEFKYRAKEFIAVRIKSLMGKTGKSYEECGEIITAKTYEIQINQLVNKLGKNRDECIELYREKGEDLIHDNHLKEFAFSFDDAYKELIERL